MDFLTSIWRNVELLKSASSIFHWFSIALIFLGGLLQIGKYFIDRQEKELFREEQNKIRVNHEDKVSLLEGEIFKQKSVITELNESNKLSHAKVNELSNPYIKPIRTGTVTVTISVENPENQDINTHYMDQGGYFALGIGNNEVIIMAASSCWARKSGDKEITYKEIYDLDVSHKIVGSPVYKLQEAEYAQIWFRPMKNDIKILKGVAICTINDSVQMKLNIPSTQAQGDKILVRDIKEMFLGFHN